MRALTTEQADTWVWLYMRELSAPRATQYVDLRSNPARWVRLNDGGIAGPGDEGPGNEGVRFESFLPIATGQRLIVQGRRAGQWRSVQ